MHTFNGVRFICRHYVHLHKFSVHSHSYTLKLCAYQKWNGSVVSDLVAEIKLSFFNEHGHTAEITEQITSQSDRPRSEEVRYFVFQKTSRSREALNKHSLLFLYVRVQFVVKLRANVVW